MSIIPPFFRPTIRAFAVVALSLACSESPLAPVTPLPSAVAAIEVTPASPTVVRGATLPLAATPKAASGQTLQDRTITWTSLEPELLTISAAGVATGIAEGTATVSVRAEQVTRYVDIVVTAAPLASVEPSVASLVLSEGRAETVTAIVRNAFGEPVPDVPLAWTSLSPSVATVDGGAVTALKEGSATIRVSAGTLSADVIVEVRPVFGGDLVFASPNGPFGSSRLYRMTGADYASTRPLVDLNGFSQPSVSPDGQRIAFTCPGTGPGICVANIDGSNVVQLTPGESTYEDQPAWSPDGSKIAFRRYSAIGGVGPWNPSDIWIINPDGTGQLNLTADNASQHWPTWSPAGTPGGPQIAYVQDSTVDGYETSRLAVMARDGGSRRMVTAAGMHVESRPQWMPGGTALLFTRTGGEFQDAIRVVTVATGVERAFLATALPPGGQFHPTLSPNGRYVVFASKHEEVSGTWAPQVYTARIDGTDVRRRSDGTNGKGEFAWVPTP